MNLHIWINVVVVATLAAISAFASYLVMKQRGKNRLYQKQLIRLEILNKTIIQSNNSVIDGFYNSLHLLKDDVMNPRLSAEGRIQLNNLYKEKFSSFRKLFVDELRQIDKLFALHVLEIMDALNDDITEAIFQEPNNLSTLENYESMIGSKIIKSKRELIKLLCNYNGS